MKTRACVWVVAFGFLAASSFDSRADFSAFNDLAWSTGQWQTAITKYAPGGTTNGVLVSHPGGSASSVRVVVSGAAGTAVYLERIPSGSDADASFVGKVSCSNGIYWSAGDITLTFTGLNPARQYEFAAFSSRGSTCDLYSNRFTLATLADVSAFLNRSSTGAVVSTSVMSNDTTRIVGGNLSGFIYKYTAIEPGTDGDMQVRFRPYANPGYSTNAYLNAFMLMEYGGGPVFFVR
jgi:hypothetical protein